MTEIRAESLTHVYRHSGVRALDGVDLVIGTRERVAVIGQNGSGKTTLVQHLNGLLRPTAGRVILDGVDAARRSVAQLAASVALAFQDPDRQLFRRTVRAEVEFGPRNLGLRGADLRSAVDEALDTLVLAPLSGENPYDLAASERKLVTIASVLAMRTPVVVLDEPTTGQDARGVQRIVEAVGRVHAEGRTVIAVSHDMEFVAATFERVVVMRSGRVALDGATSVVFADSSWETLASAELEPPAAAVAGARLGLGSTPSDAALVAALRARARSGAAADEDGRAQ